MSRREYVLQKLKKASRIYNKLIPQSLRTASNLMSMFTTEIALEIYPVSTVLHLAWTHPE
jgi:hypothetical protein